MPQQLNFFFLVTRLRLLAMAVVVAWVSGCALAPGLSIGKGFDRSAGQSGTTGTGPNDAPPPGALMSITPELISRQRAQQVSVLGNDVKGLFADPSVYGIGPGDVINIVVWNHPELVLSPAGATLTTDASGLASVGNGYNVSPDGLIQFPLLGTFSIAGLTENKAREELVRRLSKFLKDPQVTLRVQAYRAGRVYLDGEVKTPGLLAINDIPMTLPEAISRAGGLTPLADRTRVAVTRKGATTVINMPQLGMLGVNPARIMLAAGDLVRVGNRNDTKIYVTGEVAKPVALPLRNGRLTLNEALGEAGGVSPNSGDPRQIYVVRSRSGEGVDSEDRMAGEGAGKAAQSGAANAARPAATATAPEIYHLDGSSAASYALAEGFELKSRDVVFVDPVPLVLWSRVLSLILPGSQVIDLTRTTLDSNNP